MFILLFLIWFFKFQKFHVEFTQQINLCSSFRSRRWLYPYVVATERVHVADTTAREEHFRCLLPSPKRVRFVDHIIYVRTWFFLQKTIISNT